MVDIFDLGVLSVSIKKCVGNVIKVLTYLSSVQVFTELAHWADSV